MLLLPIGTNAPLKNRPYVNYVLIAINAAAFIVFDIFGATPAGASLPQVKNQLILHPGMPELYQFFSYQFLHGGWVHIIGNMWFLYLFGNPVNSKMGDLPYLLFYLAGGAFAGIGFSLTELYSPVLGASGSVAAVTTAYLVLFPRTVVRIFYWIFFIGDIEIGSITLIVGKMIIWDNIIASNLVTGPGGAQRAIAYEAHLSGYAFGFVAALLMLLVHALPRDPFDIVSLWNRWHRRREFAGVYREPGVRAPVAHTSRSSWGRHHGSGTLPTGPQARADELRAEIARSTDRFDTPAAARLYRDLLKIDPSQILARSSQLDVANQLTEEGDFPLAADAYEKFLDRYPTGPTAQQVGFLLGVIYARHLQDYGRAVKHLEGCRPNLSDPNMIQQCEYWLDVARQQTGGSDAPSEPA